MSASMPCALRPCRRALRHQCVMQAQRFHINRLRVWRAPCKGAAVRLAPASCYTGVTSMFRAGLLALAAAALFTSAPAGAGTLIASGDATTAFRLGSGIAGNVQFARNVLGTGTQVSVFGE